MVEPRYCWRSGIRLRMGEPERHSLSLKTWLSYYSHSEGRREAGQTQRCTKCYPGRVLLLLAIPGWPLGSAYRGLGWLCPPLGQPNPGDSLLVGRALPQSPQAWSDPTTCKIGWSVASLLRNFTWTLSPLGVFSSQGTVAQPLYLVSPGILALFSNTLIGAFSHQGPGCHLCWVGTVRRVSTTAPKDTSICS